jgi:hypothetical protein
LAFFSTHWIIAFNGIYCASGNMAGMGSGRLAVSRHGGHLGLDSASAGWQWIEPYPGARRRLVD